VMHSRLLFGVGSGPAAGLAGHRGAADHAPTPAAGTQRRRRRGRRAGRVGGRGAGPGGAGGGVRARDRAGGPQSGRPASSAWRRARAGLDARPRTTCGPPSCSPPTATLSLRSEGRFTMTLGAAWSRPWCRCSRRAA
jgi:hypothetical protein